MPRRKSTAVQRKLNFETVSSTRSKTSYTPASSCEDEEQDREATRASSTESPPRKKPKLTETSTVVTPDEKRESTKEGVYVPKYIFQNLGYKRQGESSGLLSTEKAASFKLVCQYYHIPDNLEQCRSFGPLAGSCFEERLLQAYTLNQLVPVAENVDICTVCASVGHRRCSCPTLI